ncbi:hypothetical protein X798_01905 [Onchocerca flexuosa]|uniref:Uncharacterized protein n=1 Tax=Onchocerca flexuosa TaxID=387005 RepID=A0A238C0V5_9BILA|nr:hypothetical protein X798_01905 [Onchocerca flexuosa]
MIAQYTSILLSYRRRISFCSQQAAQLVVRCLINAIPYLSAFLYNMFKRTFLIFSLAMLMVTVESKQFEIKEFENPTLEQYAILS